MDITIDSKKVPGTKQFRSMAKDIMGTYSGPKSQMSNYLASRLYCSAGTITRLCKNDTKDLSFRVAFGIMALHAELGLGE